MADQPSRQRSEPNLSMIYHVITSAPDGQDHLIADRVAPRTCDVRSRAGYPAVRGYTVRPETDIQKTGH